MHRRREGKTKERDGGRAVRRQKRIAHGKRRKNAPPADGLRGGAEGKAGEQTDAVSSALFSAEEPLQ